MNQELFTHLDFAMKLVPSILVIVLACLARKLVGKGWLIALVVSDLVATIGFWIVSNILRHSHYSYSYVNKWYSVLDLIGILGTFCFGIFLFSNYCVSRLKLDMNQFLFSFSGRIPRSALWIWICLSSACGTLIGILAYGLLTETGNDVTSHVGLPIIIFFVLYACCVILNTWMSLAVYAKRWHDCSKSGWMTLILFVPVIGAFWVIGYLGFVRGTDGPNQYGESPFIAQP